MDMDEMEATIDIGIKMSETMTPRILDIYIDAFKRLEKAGMPHDLVKIVMENIQVIKWKNI